MSLEEQFKELTTIVDRAKALIGDLSQALEFTRTTQAHAVQDLLSQLGYLKVSVDEIKNFLKKPYVLIPRKSDEWYLIVPRFIEIEMGWLYRQTDQYNIFIINRYVNWVYSIPEEVKNELDFKEPKIKPIVEGDILNVKPEETDEAFRRYRPYLIRREGEGRLRIASGKRFNLITEIIRDGFIPFKPQPIDSKDLVERYPKFELRDYQKEGWDDLSKYGNIGVYWSSGVGKMFFGVYALCRIKVGRLPNLIIVPTRTLIEEWTRKLKQ